MKALYYDFVNGLRDVEMRHVLAEYNFAKENNLKFCYVALNIAAMAIRNELSYEVFCNIYNDTNVSEASLFRSLAKLQNQVKRLVKLEEDEFQELVNDGLKYVQDLNSKEESEDSEDENEGEDIEECKEDEEKEETYEEKLLAKILEGEINE